MIVGDACSIILLAKSTVLEEFAKRNHLTIPQEVYREVTAGKEKKLFDALLMERLAKEKKIVVLKTANPSAVEKLAHDFGMGKGEAETLSLTLEDPRRIILTDNKQGRKAAKIHGLHLIGSLEVVAALYKLQHIEKEKAFDALQVLRQVGWFEEHLIKQAEEEMNNEGNEQ